MLNLYCVCLLLERINSVSYTHLDVYKRQVKCSSHQNLYNVTTNRQAVALHSCFSIVLEYNLIVKSQRWSILRNEFCNENSDSHRTKSYLRCCLKRNKMLANKKINKSGLVTWVCDDSTRNNKWSDLKKRLSLIHI